MSAGQHLPNISQTLTKMAFWLVDSNRLQFFLHNQNRPTSVGSLNLTAIGSHLQNYLFCLPPGVLVAVWFDQIGGRLKAPSPWFSTVPCLHIQRLLLPKAGIPLILCLWFGVRHIAVALRSSTGLCNTDIISDTCSTHYRLLWYYLYDSLCKKVEKLQNCRMLLVQSYSRVKVVMSQFMK